MQTFRKNIIFIVLIVVILVAGLVWYYSLEPSQSGDTKNATDSDNEFSRVRDEILANIQALEAIRLDTTILQDEAFLRLRELQRSSIRIEAGRPNPFLPYQALSGGVIFSASSSLRGF